MTRILLITNIFPPHIGGPATFIDHLGHALAHQGHQVTVICSSDRPTEPSDAQRPFRVRRIWFGRALLYHLRLHVTLLQEMLRHTRILVSGLEDPASQIARLIRRQYILRVGGDDVWQAARNIGVTSLSSDEFEAVSPTTHGLTRLVDRRTRAMIQARMIMATSHSLRRKVIQWGAEPTAVTVVYNGIARETFAPYAPVRRTTNRLEIAFCGRLTNFKGVETLLLAVSQMDDIQVTIIGDGPEMPMLVGLAQQLSLTDRVRFTGRLARKPLFDTLSRVHVLVLVPSYEAHSNTLLEASAMGLACIASDRGGNPEIITHEETGLLVPYGDVAALRAALTRLQEDEDLRYTLACNARANSARFDFRATVNQTMRLLLEQPADQ